MIVLNSYDQIIFDCDGVVLDSNLIKEDNILNTVLKYTDETTANEFAEYFVKNNGIPRGVKIRSFFKDEELAQKILNTYGQLNLSSLVNARIVEGIVELLEQIKARQKDVYLLSGGEKDELDLIFQKKDLLSYFTAILGGPRNKRENLEKIKLTGKTLFFGDSEVDYEVSKEFNFDFIYV